MLDIGHSSRVSYICACEYIHTYYVCAHIRTVRIYSLCTHEIVDFLSVVYEVTIEWNLLLTLQCSCIHSLSSCSCIAIGSESGHLYFISMLQPRKPNLVSRQLLYHSPLSLVAHDQGGHFVVAASRHSSDIYVLDGRPSGSFQVVGHTSIGWKLQCGALSSAFCVITFVGCFTQVRVGWCPMSRWLAQEMAVEQCSY